MNSAQIQTVYEIIATLKVYLVLTWSISFRKRLNLIPTILLYFHLILYKNSFKLAREMF